MEQIVVASVLQGVAPFSDIATGVLVVARSFALSIVTLQVKFASSMPMRSPVFRDWAVGYIVDS